MPRTQEQLEQAAREAQAWLETLDPADLEPEDTTDLRAIAIALAAVADAQGQLRDTVISARSNGRSWGRISTILGVSKQSARERYDRPTSVANH